jgi:lantibiotic transport system ATP-binding protein
MDDYLIETRELSRRFGSKLAVDDLNLLVPAAGVCGFLGPNGAGKTTAIRMLLGLIKPTVKFSCSDYPCIKIGSR